MADAQLWNFSLLTSRAAESITSVPKIKWPSPPCEKIWMDATLSRPARVLLIRSRPDWLESTIMTSASSFSMAWTIASLSIRESETKTISVCSSTCSSIVIDSSSVPSEESEESAAASGESCSWFASDSAAVCSVSSAGVSLAVSAFSSAD